MRPDGGLYENFALAKSSRIEACLRIRTSAAFRYSLQIGEDFSICGCFPHTIRPDVLPEKVLEFVLFDFRPPEGAGIPQSLDTTGVSFITRRDSLDWKGISADQITRRVLDRVQPGSIVLFHNAAEHTPEALPGILEALLADGYRVVPISEILLDGDCLIDSTGRQCRQ